MTKLHISHNFETVYGFVVPSVYMESNEYFSESQINVSLTTWINKEARGTGKQPIQLANFSTNLLIEKKNVSTDGPNLFQDEQDAIMNTIYDALIALGVTEESIEVLQ